MQKMEDDQILGKEMIVDLGESDRGDAVRVTGGDDFGVPFSPTDFVLNLEAQAAKLARSLHGWGEVILPARSVLLWEKSWHPGAIAGGSTVFFLILFLLDPSVLTTLSVLGLTLVVSDYLVPTLTSRLFDSEEFWTPANKNAFTELCRTVIIYKERVAVSCATFYVKRTTNPKLYYCATIVTLAVLAWIGNNINNLLLTYVLVTVLLLVPGLEHRGLLRNLGSSVSNRLANIKPAQKEQ